MLSLKPYLSIIKAVEVGETQRVNHEECEAGEDTRRRLYITRPLADPTKVVAYCHNCQQGTSWRDSKYASYRDNKHKGTVPLLSEVRELVVPKNMVYELSQWPVYAQAWAMKNRLTQGMCNRAHISFDPSSDRVYLPRYKHLDYYTGVRGDLVGYQLRDTIGKGPKYLTVQRREEEPLSLLTQCASQLECAVIVEDLVSGIHIAEAAKKNNAPLDIHINYGVKINNHLLYKLKDTKHIMVWLDNDSAHVINQAKHILRTAGLFAPNASLHLVENYSDPKHYLIDRIIEIMDEAWIQ